MKCDKCDNPATVHLIEIKNGKKLEKHLCEQHAAEEGVTVKISNAPINELLEKFVLKHSGAEVRAAQLTCESCGMTYAEFRKNGLLGCPECYSAFESALMPLLERAHDGASQHLGKAPTQAGPDEQRQRRLLQLRREMEEAVASEQYELAARLRDSIRKIEAHEE
jgi:protein arginine kinase activator